MKNYFVYIVGSINGVLYVGVTNNLERRLYEHKQGLIEGFTKKYKCKKLLYFEMTTEVEVALNREKQLKKWSRVKKEALISKVNPTFKDLSTSLEMTKNNEMTE